MLRPGWFPEYSPKQQQIFDSVYSIIAQNFAQYGYQHIRTPAVEQTHILKKWWEESSKQIFGLHGLAQWSEDVKDYALHFDLTIPFARYALDRQNELAFPFKRYQIQPVWRGERNQKGRFKEFRQADIDVIRKSKDDKWYNTVYDADCILTLATTLHKVLETIGLQKSIVVRYNNRKFMQDIFARLKVMNGTEVFGVLDKFYKMTQEEFDTELSKVLTPEQMTQIKKLWDLEQYAADFPEVQTYIAPFTQQIKPYVQNLQWVEIVFDPSIVRGLDYYTGTVFETFIDNKISLGSICSWWSYANLTDFIDKKQSFSGVGGSIGLSRLVSVLIEDYDVEKIYRSSDTYMIINDGNYTDTASKIIQKLRWENKVIELFPLVEDFIKQIKYAQQKGVSYIIKIKSDKEYEIVKTQDRQGTLHTI